jgi:hypothetical protein
MSVEQIFLVMEAVREACRQEFGVYHTFEGRENHEVCLILEKGGLIVRHNEEPGHVLWVPAGR